MHYIRMYMLLVYFKLTQIKAEVMHISIEAMQHDIRFSFIFAFYVVGDICSYVNVV